jgi:hypothetical protein
LFQSLPLNAMATLEFLSPGQPTAAVEGD